MPRRTLEQQLADAEARTARLRSQFKKAARKLDTRCKVVIGGMVVAAMREDPAFRAQISALLRQRVTRPLDREAVAEWLATT
jgi:hypothetical protein